MKFLFFANTDWYLFNFRLSLAQFLRSLGHEVVMVSPPGNYGVELERLGFRWHPLAMSRAGLNPFSELVSVCRLLAIYRRERPDIAHHFTIKCVIYGGLAAIGCRSARVVNSVTGLGHIFTTKSMFTTALRPLVSALYRYVLRRSFVIFQNPDDHQSFISRGLVSTSKSTVIRGSGVDTKRFNPAQRRNHDSLTVLFIGRLIFEKGIREFVDAAAEVHKTFPDVRFVVAGDVDPGNPTSVPGNVIEMWKGKKIVDFVGHQHGVERLLSSCDIVVLPSYREGTPRSLLEAAACGLPLVATDVPGCREVVRHRWNGLLVPPMDADALRSAIEELCGARSLRTAMGRNSRRLAVDVFDQRHVFAATLAIYQNGLPDTRATTNAVELPQ